MSYRRFRRCLRCLGQGYFVASVLMFLVSTILFLSMYISMPHIEKNNKKVQISGLPSARGININSRSQGPGEGMASGKRQNLIIVAHGRSGSSFTGNIFNHHPSVFYLFEPYQTAERLHGKVEPFDKDYEAKSLEWINGLLKCDFVSPRHAQDLDHYYRKVMRRESRLTQASLALSSPPFCRFSTYDPMWSQGSCKETFDQKMLEQVCKTNYSMTVMKALFGRMPQTNIKHLIQMCDASSEFECKILFLVRDPRGIIPSSQAVNFFRDKDRIGLSRTREFSYLNCKRTEENLDILRSLPAKWRKRIKILRYEDLALNPSKGLAKLLEFAELPVNDALSKWLHLASHKGETKSEQDANPWRQDSAEGANRWRWKVMPYDITVIEHYCKHVMKLLGYKRLNLSYEIQRQIDISLIEDDFEASRWLVD